MSLLGFINYQPSAPSLFLGSVSLKRPVFVSKPAKKKKKKTGSSNLSNWSSISSVPQEQGEIYASSQDFSTENFI